LRAHGVRSIRPLHTLRKEFGSQINQTHGIHAASRALRHAEIGITSAIYVDNRVRTTSGLGYLLGESQAPRRFAASGSQLKDVHTRAMASQSLARRLVPGRQRARLSVVLSKKQRGNAFGKRPAPSLAPGFTRLRCDSQSPQAGGALSKLWMFSPINSTPCI
jgi:hypothetical protein